MQRTIVVLRVGWPCLVNKCWEHVFVFTFVIFKIHLPWLDSDVSIAWTPFFSFSPFSPPDDLLSFCSSNFFQFLISNFDRADTSSSEIVFLKLFTIKPMRVRWIRPSEMGNFWRWRKRSRACPELCSVKRRQKLVWLMITLTYYSKRTEESLRWIIFSSFLPILAISSSVAPIFQMKPETENGKKMQVVENALPDPGRKLNTRCI